jgi:hypothetical protein
VPVAQTRFGSISWVRSRRARAAWERQGIDQRYINFVNDHSLDAQIDRHVSAISLSGHSGILRRVPRDMGFVIWLAGRCSSAIAGRSSSAAQSGSDPIRPRLALPELLRTASIKDAARMRGHHFRFNRSEHISFLCEG